MEVSEQWRLSDVFIYNSEEFFTAFTFDFVL